MKRRPAAPKIRQFNLFGCLVELAYAHDGWCITQHNTKHTFASWLFIGVVLSDSDSLARGTLKAFQVIIGPIKFIAGKV